MTLYWSHRPTTWTILPSHLLGLKRVRSLINFYGFKRNIIIKHLLRVTWGGMAGWVTLPPADT